MGRILHGNTGSFGRSSVSVVSTAGPASWWASERSHARLHVAGVRRKSPPTNAARIPEHFPPRRPEVSLHRTGDAARGSLSVQDVITRIHQVPLALFFAQYLPIPESRQGSYSSRPCHLLDSEDRNRGRGNHRGIQCVGRRFENRKHGPVVILSLDRRTNIQPSHADSPLTDIQWTKDPSPRKRTRVDLPGAKCIPRSDETSEGTPCHWPV